MRQLSFVYPEQHPVLWKLESSTGEYARWQDGERHVDSAGKQITTGAVIVQQVSVSHSSYFGDVGYHEVALVGSGSAVLFASGRKRAATWRRGRVTDPTRFFDTRGGEISLPPGRLFVQLVGIGTEMTETA